MARLAAFALPFALAAAAFAPRAGAQEPPRAPFLDSGPRAWRDRTYDLQHVDFDLTFDLKARTIRGVATEKLEPLFAGLRELAFDAEEIRVTRATVDGREVSVRADAKRVYLALPEPVGPGKALEVKLEYEGSPTTGLHWTGPEPGRESKPWQVYSQGEDEDNHHWIPLHDFPNDRTTWSCTLRVDKSLTAVSNGRALGVTDDPGGATRAWRYAMEQPNVTYLIAVAIAPYERYVDKWRTTPVEYFVPVGTGEARARRSFGRTPEMMEVFSKWIGVDYPWPKYAQMVVTEFVVGGMENVSATIQTDQTLHDERSHLERDSEGLVSHELAHQWWGDLLTCNGWRHLWLNEGFATYFTAIWLEQSKGIDDYRLYMDGQRRGFLAADSIESPRALVTTPSNRRDDAANAHVYVKGSSVLHMLRFVVGDELFRASIGEFCRRHRMGLVETRDLERAVADVTGRDLEWFWHEWVYSQGAPSFEVRHRFDDEKKAAVVSVKQSQKVSATVPVFRMPVDLLFGFADGETRLRRVWIEKAEHEFEFPFPARPTFVRFDEGSWIAARVNHERVVDELVAQAVGDPDVVGRKEACERLGEKDEPAAVRALADKLASKDARDVRVAAAAALRARKGDAAKAALVAALSDAEANVRRTAAESLAVYEKDADVAAALQKVMAGDAAYGPRASAVRSIGTILGADAWKHAEEALKQESERDVVGRAALEAMRRVDPVKAFPKLVSFTQNTESYEVRDTALNQAVAIAADAALRAKLAPEDLAKLRAGILQAIESTNFRLRGTAIRLAGTLDDAELATRLEKGAKEWRNARDKRNAESALATRKARLEKAAAAKP